MIENPRFEYVNQRRYGIVAPDKDLNRVTGLVTSGMAQCFGVAVFDRSLNVGMFTHLDYAEDLDKVLIASYPILDSIGINMLEVKTVNINSPHLIRYGGQMVVASRQRALDSLVEVLMRRNVADSSGWSDEGIAEDAIFEPKKGIKATTFDQLGLSQDQIEAAYQYQLSLLTTARSHNDDTRVVEISCAYRPTIILPSDKISPSPQRAET